MNKLITLTLTQKATLFDLAVEQGMLDEARTVSVALDQLTSLRAPATAENIDETLGQVQTMPEPGGESPIDYSGPTNRATRARGKRPTSAAIEKAARSSALTAEQIASRQLQGRYLAMVRRFGKRDRAHFSKIAKEKGREAAIREMQKASKGR